MESALTQSRVLVLNKVYMPVQVISVKRAFCMLYRGAVKVVDQEYQTYDFDTWTALSAAAHHEDSLGIIGRWIRLPKVVLLQTYDKLPKRNVRFSRFNIFARDGSTCQYCGRKFTKSELNLDHVIPRSQGGQTTWENIVCSCLPCNRKKGGNTPKQAHMKLIKTPQKPHWAECLNISFKGSRYREWLPFLNIVDFSYWNVELEQ